MSRKLQTNLWTQATLQILEPRTKRTLLGLDTRVTQVLATVAVEIVHRGQAKLRRRVHQLPRWTQLTLRLEEHRRFELAKYHQVALTIAVQIACRQVAAKRIQIGNAELQGLGPLTLLRLEPNDQVVRRPQVGQIRAAVTVEISNHHRRNLPIDRNLAMLEPPVTPDPVDIVVVINSHTRRWLLLALMQVVDATVTVVGQHQVDQAIAVDIVSQQVGRTTLQLEDLDRLKPEILTQWRRSTWLLSLDSGNPDRAEKAQPDHDAQPVHSLDTAHGVPVQTDRI